VRRPHATGEGSPRPRLLTRSVGCSSSQHSRSRNAVWAGSRVQREHRLIAPSVRIGRRVRAGPIQADALLDDGGHAGMLALRPRRRMTLEEADREMRTPPPCYRSPEKIDADKERFLRDAWGDDLRPFAWASSAPSAYGWCPVLPEAGREDMVRSLHALRPEPLQAGLRMPAQIVAASDASDGGRAGRLRLAAKSGGGGGEGPVRRSSAVRVQATSR
jgi:hypothetical protein